MSQISLTDGQKAVVRAFHDFGQMTDVALATYVHHIADENMSSSGVRTHRAELVRKGLVTRVGSKKMKSGKFAGIYGLTGDGIAVARRLARQDRKAAVTA